MRHDPPNSRPQPGQPVRGRALDGSRDCRSSGCRLPGAGGCAGGSGAAELRGDVQDRRRLAPVLDAADTGNDSGASPGTPAWEEADYVSFVEEQAQFEDSGHFIMFDQFNRFIEELRRFLHSIVVSLSPVVERAAVRIIVTGCRQRVPIFVKAPCVNIV